MRVYSVLLFAATLGVVACGGSSGDRSITGPSPSQSHIGTYSLTQVNGASLPVVFYSNASGNGTFISGSAVLRSDGSYQQTLTDSIAYSDGTSGGKQTSYENGTYSITGSQITFTIPADVNNAALSYSGAVDGTTISYTYSGTSLTFKKL